MVNINKYKKLLEARLAELNDRLHDIEDELDQPADPDVEERATEREGDEVLEGLGVAGQNEIVMINAALRRIESGTYGICIECEGQIIPERLDIVPHATKCKNCA